MIDILAQFVGKSKIRAGYPSRRILFLLSTLILVACLSTCKKAEKFINLPLAVSTNKATAVRLESVVFNGNADGYGGKSSVKVYFKWGSSADNLDNITSSQVLAKSQFFSQEVRGLSANKTYYFQAVIENAKDRAQGFVLSVRTDTLETDYYRAIMNTDGSLTFVDKDGVKTFLKNAPLFYFNYGRTIDSDKGPDNDSFEKDDDRDGIPDDWTVNKEYIRISSEHASDGHNSLKFNMTSPESDAKIASSSKMTIAKDRFYTVSFDYYLGSYTSGGWSCLRLYIYYYDGSSWQRTASLTDLNDFFRIIPVNIIGTWRHVSFDWMPPAKAQSFYLHFYMDSDAVAALYIDNVFVTEKSYDYTSNGSGIDYRLTAEGDSTTLTAVDDSNAFVKVTHQYVIENHSPYVQYTASLQYKQKVYVNEERFDFLIPGQNVRVMKRDFEFESFDASKAYYSDRYSPKVVKFGSGLSFLGSDTMDSTKLKALGENTQLSFYADYLLNHPHFYFTANDGVIRMDQTQRLANTQYSVSLCFAIHPSEPLKSLIKTRQPYGYDAVLTLSSHPDDWTYARTKALAYGSEDEHSKVYGIRGIASRGIGWTYGVFAVKMTQTFGLDDPTHKALVDRMYQDGVEVIGHTISPGIESRQDVLAGLQTLAKYDARNWMDHGVSTGTGNFEGLCSRGALKGDDYYILDLLDQYNYQYAWSYIDLSTEENALNMLEPEGTSAIRPFLFYNNRVDDNISDQKKIFLWSTVNTNKRPEEYYTRGRIDSLIRERGAHIGHEYFGYQTCENHAFYDNDGTIEIYPKFDSQLEYIAEKRADCQLWSPTVAALGGYLVPLKDVALTYNPDGTIRVTNNSYANLTGITLLAEQDVRSVAMNHHDLVSFGGFYGDREIVLPTLVSGESLVLEITYGNKDSSKPTIVSNNRGKNKVNEITGYWDDVHKILTMTAEARKGRYSFSVRIPSLANKTIRVKDLTTDMLVGEYRASDLGEITFTVYLGSLRTFKIGENISK